MSDGSPSPESAAQPTPLELFLMRQAVYEAYGAGRLSEAASRQHLWTLEHWGTASPDAQRRVRQVANTAA